jgi:hypothetical protein
MAIAASSNPTATADGSGRSFMGRPDRRLRTGARGRRRRSGGIGDVRDLRAEVAYDVVGGKRRGDTVAAGTEGDPLPDDALVGDDRQGRRRPEGRDRPALVAGHLAGDLGVRHGDPVDAEERTQLGPGDLAVSGHEDEKVVALATADTIVFTMADGSTPRAAAASARDPTRPWRVTECSIPEAASAASAGVSSTARPYDRGS